jgi:putative membrane protein
MMYWGDGAIGGWGIFGMMTMAVFGIVIIVLVIWGIKRFTEANTDNKGALSIAKERYARGEISKQEFEQMKRDLS